MRSLPLVRVAAAALAASLATSIALAKPAVVADPNESRGALDIHRTSASPRSHGKVVRHTIATYDWWRSTYLRGAGPKRYVCFYIWDEHGKPRPGRQDFQMCASYSRGQLRASVTKVKTSATRAVSVHRPGLRKIVFDLPRAKLGLGAYHWLAATRDGGIRSFDIAPDSGPRRQRRPR
jgi:hypothetical protein